MNRSTLIKIIGTVIIALIAPILSYTIFQFVQQTENEAMITSIYERQLSTLLFSVNMHCWDQWNSWRTGMAGFNINPGNVQERSELHNQMRRLIDRQSATVGIYLETDAGRSVLIWKNSSSRFIIRQDIARLHQIVTKDSSNIQKMNDLAGSGYVRPTIIPWDNEENIALILFPLVTEEDNQKRHTNLAGLFVDKMVFVHDIVARKFDEMNEGDFVFAIHQKADDQIIYTTSEDEILEPFEIRETLWILPDMELMIKIQGSTLSQLSSRRVRWNLMFIVFVNIVLFAGIIYLFRNVYNEITLAQMKTDFVANVSHELRTPLSLIRMYAETLELGRVKSEEKKQHYYQIIVNETARLTQLINNILDFSRIESRRKEFHLRYGDIVKIVRDTINMYRFHIEMKDFSLKFKCPSTLPPVLIDADAITLALVNLLDNAIKFSGDNKIIEVTVSHTTHSIVVSVTDHGIGIPDAEVGKIFDKFYRIESSLVHNTKGSGLGLSLVRHIMNIHHGRVDVQSKPGSGSTFSLVFPVDFEKGA